MERTGPVGVVRWAWTGAGLVCVGIGSVGIVVPGLPTTVFFIAAAACFTRSSPRLERWVLELPGIGPAVRDHRAGLGMRRRAKLLAISSIAVFSAFAAVVADDGRVVATVLAAAAVGVLWIWWKVPTRERVLEARAGS